jgi:hypothetical protein
MFLISLVMLLALANGAFANEFTGAVDNRFCDPGNWDPAAVPLAGDEVEIADFNVVVDCDVASGTLLGPGWDTDDYGSLTVNAGSTITFTDAARHESESPWVFNIAGSMTIGTGGGEYRFADEGHPIWNISGAGASLVISVDLLRAGDNGGTGWDVNIDSGVLVLDTDVEIGDDGSGAFDISGTASVSVLGDFQPHMRDGDSTFDLTLSGDAEMVVTGKFTTNDKDDGAGTGTINITGGTLNVGEDFGMGLEDGPTNLTVSGGLVVVGDTLEIGRGTANLEGGVVRAGDLDIGDNGVMNIVEGGGVLILDGNKLATVGSLVADGKLVAMPCASTRGIQADYGVTNPGKTTVISCCTCIDECQAWAPVPADGASEVHSVVTDVILSWTEGDCLGTRGRSAVYFGDDPVAVENAVIASPEFKGYKNLGSPSYNAGNLPLWETFYWRIDQINYLTGKPPLTKGEVWSFTTGCAAIAGDVNMDCLVNFLDYAELAATFGMEELWPE